MAKLILESEMPQVIIKRNGGSSRSASNENLSDEIIVIGDNIVVNPDSSITVTDTKRDESQADV